MENPSEVDLAASLKACAAKLGLSRIGITGASRPPNHDRYLEWIAKGHAADLWYLTERTRVEKRRDLQRLLPGARSVIVAALSYAPRQSQPPSDAKFGRYAWGKDYHRVLGRILGNLRDFLRSQVREPFQCTAHVDTGPILERSLAERAGVGWIGKNTCVIHESTGSYLFLGELITTLELPPDRPSVNRCGTCTRCLDACPTGALVAPFELRSDRCISYQTLENRGGEIPLEIAAELDSWVAGCDICQEVCPWNRNPPVFSRDELRPLPHVFLSLAEVADLPAERFPELFGPTTLRRLGWTGLVRNARAALRHRRGFPGLHPYSERV